MANLPYVPQYIRVCLMEEDYEKVFLYEDYTITPLTKTIPIKIGSLQVNSKPIPMEVQEHASFLLQKSCSHTLTNDINDYIEPAVKSTVRVRGYNYNTNLFWNH